MLADEFSTSISADTADRPVPALATSAYVASPEISRKT